MQKTKVAKSRMAYADRRTEKTRYNKATSRIYYVEIPREGT